MVPQDAIIKFTFEMHCIEPNYDIILCNMYEVSIYNAVKISHSELQYIEILFEQKSFSFSQFCIF